MTNTLYLPELREMLAENNSVELEEFCTALHPARTAEFMEGLTAAEAWSVLLHADANTRGQIFGYFDFEKQLEIIQTSDRLQIGKLIAELPADDRVDILKEVPHETVEQLLPLVPPRERRDIIRLLAYPEGTAGAMMTTSYARLREGMTVRAALDALGREAEDIETIYYVFVLDADEHLRGVVSARQLISAVGKPNLLIDDLMERAVVSVDIADSQELVAQRVAKYDLHAIPVVDHEHHMLGIITHDDVIDVMSEEATEDAYRMAAIEPMEENYLEASYLDVWRKRSFWLLSLFLAEFLTFTVMTYFETEMKAVFVLSLFVPLVISVGGNSGSQAATLITRAIALGHVGLDDWLRVLRHELLMGVALGATLGAAGLVRGAATSANVLDGVNRWSMGLTVGTAVMGICMWGTIVGSMLPVLFKRMGFDPGYASTPFVATFVDVTGIVIYFTVARLYLL
jgi:magnesium transporter